MSAAEKQEEREAAFLEAEAARIRERIAARPEPGLLEYPYCQVVGRSAAVLLQPEQIAFILYAMQNYGDGHPLAGAVEGEMWRAQLELKKASRAGLSAVQKEPNDV